MLDTAHIGPIIDYIHQLGSDSSRRRSSSPPGVVEAKVAAPAGFRDEGAHASVPVAAGGVVAQNAGEGAAAAGRVAPLGHRRLRVCRGLGKGGNVKIWTITELLGTKALVAEGRIR